MAGGMLKVLAAPGLNLEVLPALSTTTREDYVHLNDPTLFILVLVVTGEYD